MRKSWKSHLQFAVTAVVFLGSVVVLDAFTCDDDDPSTSEDEEETVLLTITMTNNDATPIHILLPDEGLPAGRLNAGESRTRQQEVGPNGSRVFRAMRNDSLKASKSCSVGNSFETRQASVTWNGLALTCVGW